MSVTLLIGSFLAAFLVALALVPPVRALALRQGWLDQPDGERKLHVEAVPAVGGVVIAAGLAAGLSVLVGIGGADLLPLPLIAAGLLIFGVGLYDDLLHLGYKRKFMFQALAAYLAVWAGYTIDLSGLPFVSPDPETQMLLSLPLTMLWIVGVMNAVNFLDGLDGLAAGVVAIALTSLAVIFGLAGQLQEVGLAVCLIGAIGGFLFYNFNPASIFMGDSGSLLLGFALAVFAIAAPGSADPVMALALPAVALGLPVLDTAVTILRRLLAGRSPFAPDGDHIHHRILQRSDQSVRRAVLVLYSIAGAFGLGAIVLAYAPRTQGLLIIVLMTGLTYMLLRVLGYPRLRATMRVLRRGRTRRRLAVAEKAAVAAEAARTPATSQVPAERGDGMRDTAEPVLVLEEAQSVSA